MHVLLLFCTLAAATGWASECVADCWLNGDCIAGTCVCDLAWTGPACSVLAELPGNQVWPPPDPLPANVSTLPSSWGASIVLGDDGLFHAFIESVCRSFTWMHIAGSVVVHATAAQVTGPYAFHDVALPQQSMTPHIVRDTDGAWLLLHQRNATVKGDPQCTGHYLGHASAQPAAAPPPNATQVDGPPSIARSFSLYGPWVPFDFNISAPPGRMIDNPNPSLLVLPASAGGGYLLAFTHRSIPPAPYNEAVSLAFAEDWRAGSFTPLGSDATSLGAFDCEDPHLYRTARGCHIICHRRGDPNPWGYASVGGYGASRDCKTAWAWAPTPIFSTDVQWAPTAGAPISFSRRERPEVLMGADGKPAYLLSGVEVATGAVGQPSLSVLTPLGPPPAPPAPPPRRYAVQVLDKSPLPVLSQGLPRGQGYSPCNLTFNPAFFEAHPPGLNRSFVLVRASGCPAEYGGEADHLLMAFCERDGVCGDVLPTRFPFEPMAEDPRVYWNEQDSMYYVRGCPCHAVRTQKGRPSSPPPLELTPPPRLLCIALLLCLWHQSVHCELAAQRHAA